MAQSGQDAYCTLLTTDHYLPGVMALAHSLKDNGTRKQLVALVTLDSLSSATIGELKSAYNHIIPVDRITNRTPANLYLMNRLDLSASFTKIALWRQTQFRRIVYIDADVVALRAPDELFSLESVFAAAPDVGWPDCFNSGVMVLTPNMGDYYALLALAQRGVSFDGADQGLLNMHFRNWDRISFAYNCTPSGHYQYIPAYRHFQSSISMVHFIGKDKPWLVGRKGNHYTGAYEELLGRWWAVYDKHYRAPALYTSGQGLQDAGPVQQYVMGEEQNGDYGFSSAFQTPPAPAPATEVQQREQVPESTTEQPLTEHSEKVKGIKKSEFPPVPTRQEIRFSAPQSEWDPIKTAPPVHSRPEAANFPSQVYTMSSDHNLFQAPKAYPEAPKNMWYEVPKASASDERPKPIFPWEATQTPATRVFADDEPLSPEPEPLDEPPDVAGADTPASNESPPTPTGLSSQHFSSSRPFASFSRVNAWDEVEGIARYVAAIQQAKFKAPVQIVAETIGTLASIPSNQRRPSLILTDFPSALERPSLPVTPAPISRPNFWGGGVDAESGQLPGAEGVPKQEEWDPVSRLEQLQLRQSEVFAQGPGIPTNRIPSRQLPQSATTSLPNAEETDALQTSVSTKASTSKIPAS